MNISPHVHREIKQSNTYTFKKDWHIALLYHLALKMCIQYVMLQQFPIHRLIVFDWTDVPSNQFTHYYALNKLRQLAIDANEFVNYSMKLCRSGRCIINWYNQSTFCCI